MIQYQIVNHLESYLVQRLDSYKTEGWKTVGICGSATIAKEFLDIYARAEPPPDQTIASYYIAYGGKLIEDKGEISNDGSRSKV